MKRLYYPILLVVLMLLLASCVPMGHEHQYGEWRIQKAATCTEAGIKVSVCICGDKKTDTIPMLAHTPSDWIIDKAASCKEDGLRHKECTECEVVVNIEPIDKLTTHTPAAAVRENEVASTCEELGSYDSVVYCSVCDAELSREGKEIAKKAHAPSDWITDKAATCKETGSRHKECTWCKIVLNTETIDKLTTHTPAAAVRENEVDSTCEELGSYDSVVYCSLCDAEVSREGKEIAKKAHTPSDWITDKAASCKEDGLRHKECTECEVVLKIESIDKLTAHTSAAAVRENEVDSTCARAGSYDSVVYCSICHAELSREGKEIAKKAHTPSDWITDKAASCKESGSRHKECTACKTVLNTETINKLTTHTPAAAVRENEADSTCAKVGSYDSVVYCSVCHAELSRERKEIAKKAHTSSDWITDKEPTYTEAGSRHKECTVCGETLETEQIDPPEHTHSFGAWFTEKNATCTEAGVTVRVCACGRRETDTIPALGHTPSDWITDKAASCKESGSRHKECTVCKIVLNTEAIDKLTTHTPAAAVRENEVASTCAKVGSYDSVVYCSVCDAEISRESKEIAKKAHTSSDWITDKAASCKESGSRHKECTVCKTVLNTETINKLTTHTPAAAVRENEVDSTCAKVGSYDSVVYCAVCDAVLSRESKEIAKKAHTPSGWITDKAATCKESGSRHKECTACEAVLNTETISKLTTHTPAAAVRENEVDSTCAKVGSYDMVTYCAVCDAEISRESKEIAKKAHTSSDWITDKEPTYTEVGSRHKECTACKTVLNTETIDKLVLPTYTVSYSANGQSGTTAVKMGESFTLNVVEKDGYTFDGYYVGNTRITDNTGKKLASYTLASNITATAKYTRISAEVAHNGEHVGNPGELYYKSTSFAQAMARNPWDMALYNGKLYIGGGYYGVSWISAPPLNVYDTRTDEWSYADFAVKMYEALDTDSTAKAWYELPAASSSSPVVVGSIKGIPVTTDKEISNFRWIGGKLIALGADSIGGYTWADGTVEQSIPSAVNAADTQKYVMNNLGNYYAIETDASGNDVWVEYRNNILHGAYVYDAVEVDYKGEKTLMFAVGVSGTATPVKILADKDTKSYTSPKFYLKDGSVYAGNSKNRVSNFFVTDEGIFALYTLSDGTVNKIFKYNVLEGEHRFDEVRDMVLSASDTNLYLQSDVDKNGNAITDRRLFTDLMRTEAYNGYAYYTTGYLYKTKSFVKSETTAIAAPGGAIITDLLVRDGSLYVLGFKKTNSTTNAYTNYVWSLDEDDTFTEIRSFTSEGAYALSFEKDSEFFYVGLGGPTTHITSSATAVGDIVRLAINGVSHEYGEWFTEKAATCTAAGIKARVCACGAKETASIAATGHTSSSWIVDKEPTYTEAGSRHKECTKCKAVLTTESIAALTPASYTVSYSANGLSDTVTVVAGESFTLPVIVRSGYTFKGYYLGNVQVTDSNGKKLASYTLTSDISVTAAYTRIPTEADGNGEYLGNPGELYYKSTSFTYKMARNPWDLALLNGKLYVSGGYYGGAWIPAPPIYVYDTPAGEWGYADFTVKMYEALNPDNTTKAWHELHATSSSSSNVVGGIKDIPVTTDCEISTFRWINGKLYALGADTINGYTWADGTVSSKIPTDVDANDTQKSVPNNLGNYYVIETDENGNDVWVEYRNNVLHGTHVYDVIEIDYKGGKALMFAVGTSGTPMPVKILTNPATKTYLSPKFYLKDGTEYSGNSNNRVYNFFKTDEGIFAFYAHQGGTAKKIFKYNVVNGEHRFDEVRDITINATTSDTKNYQQSDVNSSGSAISTRRLFTDFMKTESYNGYAYYTTGYLYKTKSFVKSETTKIAAPNGAIITDLLARDGKLYVLGFKKTNSTTNAYTNYVWSLDENDTFTEIRSFTSEGAYALSFEKDSEFFYVGLGGPTTHITDTVSAVGNIIRLATPVVH